MERRERKGRSVKREGKEKDEESEGRGPNVRE